MNLLELIDRIYTVLEKLDPKHPNVKKINKTLATAEKALLTVAKIAWIRIDDIKEIKDEENLKSEDGWEEPKEDGWEPKEPGKEKPEEDGEPKEEVIEGEEWAWDDKKVKIKAMFWKLPPEKQEEFKWKMGEKFNSLWI